MLCFVDASYSPPHQLGVIGYQVGMEEVIHLGSLTIHGNALAEKLALQKCIEYCDEKYPGQELIIYTDHQASLKDEYPDHVRIVFTPGHLKKASMNSLQLRFSAVDKATRKELRRLTRFK